ncbi:DDE transposase family protein [Flavobacterium columnare]|uniref:DDE transposase family protein n=1 Tax=Flavobacterium columnare TaxID=996 RepID=A0AA94JQA8_9FLAO|nr:DDE transposase family protein [Flavobacterium columnare]MCH4829792.1 transcriptional regulator [Flavobacterium columnare]MCH4831591.1 transcriptional regulator [Flavobacterium columnare]MCH4831621.1 transcriptional regulator [Flavobacterium columnare]MCH4831658.1 transcriptional regulator [Flavobacterium columnare]MCH4832829.1 transcriptional regulator [Flavobacterium columnare]
MGLAKKQEKEYAKVLYLDTKQNLQKKEIAERVGVRENTLIKWIKDEDWDSLKKSLLVTRQQQISDLYDQINWLNSNIKERDVKVANFKESQIITVLTNSIKRLETETSVAETYEVATSFLEFIKPQDFELYKKLIPLFDVFINTKMK